MKSPFATNEFLPAALALSALAIVGTAYVSVQFASSANNGGKISYAPAPVSTETPDWFGIAQRPHRQATNRKTEILRSLAASPEQNDFGAEFGYDPDN
jgi:hypothetical protein